MKIWILQLHVLLQCLFWIWNPIDAFIQNQQPALRNNIFNQKENLLKRENQGKFRSTSLNFHQRDDCSFLGTPRFMTINNHYDLNTETALKSKYSSLNNEKLGTLKINGADQKYRILRGRGKKLERTRLHMASGTEPQNRRSSFLRNPFQRRNLVDKNDEDNVYDKVKGRSVTFQAEKFGESPVKEGLRSLKDYLALPPSEYSVLDPECVARIGDDSFRCEISGINFFGVRMIPILYVKVIVDPLHAKSTLDIYKLELKGSKVAEKANGTFDIKAKNIVSYRDDSNGGKLLSSTVSVEVNALVPRSNVMPSRVLEKSGSYIIQGVLNVMVPTFIKVLVKDYQRWATGNDDRAPALLEAGLSNGINLLDDSGNIDDRLNR